MFDSHYFSLLLGYGLAIILWHLVYLLYPKLWTYNEEVKLNNPAGEFAFSIIAVICIILIGQLYIHDLLIPNNGYELIDALNQILIFSPVFILLILRKQSLETIWLPSSKIIVHVFLGFIIALFAITTYWVVKSDTKPLNEIFFNIYNFKNISELIQVFLEDITIALLFVRLSSWIGTKWSVIIVAFLFAAGHIPRLLSDGATLLEMGSLLLDFGLCVLVIGTVSKSRDVWWFFMVHFAMDMTQFYGYNMV